MLRFTVTELERDGVVAAWPLVRMAAPQLDLGNWCALAEELADRGGGVIAVVAEDGRQHGVATYEPVDKRRLGKVLQVDRLVTFELTRRAPVRRILCEALDRLAFLLDCPTVAVSVPSRAFVAGTNRSPGDRPGSTAMDEVIFPDRLLSTRA